ncbi:MAG: sn-glycerol-3-phosphate ABC transporter ATP-binding protein UgpC, partial [Pseudomonadota bacterium]
MTIDVLANDSDPDGDPLEVISATVPPEQGTVEVVKGLDLDIPDGQFVVLVGPSGCGKSTTLRMIAGLEEVTKGTVRIGERDVTNVHPKDRDIAMVFQNYALYPHMTVERNMSFALRLRKVPRTEIKRRVHEAAGMLGIEDLLHRKPRQLSGGQRQRVAVGRAIVREPAAFLFDEPLSNLDAKLRTSTRAELKALHRRLKTTTVYVTHDQEEAMTLGDRVVVLKDGVIQQSGTPFEVFSRPANRFVATFIGTPPMNLLHGTVQREASAAWFVERGDGGARIALPAKLAASESVRDSMPAVLGVRPQFLSEPASAPDPDRSLVVTPDVVEPLGDLMDVHGKTAAGATVVARIPAHESMPVGEAVPMNVDADRILLFADDEAG